MVHVAKHVTVQKRSCLFKSEICHGREEGLLLWGVEAVDQSVYWTRNVSIQTVMSVTKAVIVQGSMASNFTSFDVAKVKGLELIRPMVWSSGSRERVGVQSQSRMAKASAWRY